VAADTARDRDLAGHVIGIERWSQRRLRPALGEPVVHDEYDGYRPDPALGMTALAEAFAQTRDETLDLARRAADLPPSVRAAHNDPGQLSVGGWLFCIDSHAQRESGRIRG
jgi:hypothetical protein